MYGLEEFLMQYDSPETRRAYDRDIKRFFSFSGVSAENINRIEAIKYLDHLKSSGISNSSINRMISSMKSYSKFLVFNDILTKNPFEGMKLPKIDTKQEEEITDYEIKKIVAAIKTPKEKAIIYLMLYNGLRRSEICGLNYGDIERRKVKQKDGKAITIMSITIRGKGDKVRVRPLHPLCFDSIIEYLESEGRTKGGNNEPIFIRRSSRNTRLRSKNSSKNKKKNRRTKVSRNINEVNVESRIYPEVVYRIVQSLKKRAKIGKKIHPHMFRAKFASLAIEAGVPITTVQEDLGHSSIETTAIYDKSKRSLNRSSIYGIKEIK